MLSQDRFDRISSLFAGKNVLVIGDVMLEPLMWISVLWITTTIVRAVQARQAQAERYWGI